MLDNIFHILVRPTLEKFIILLLDNLASADAILNSNLNIPLRGAAIGNGWIDGRSQYASYLPYAVKHGLVEVDSEVRLTFCSLLVDS